MRASLTAILAKSELKTRLRSGVRVWEPGFWRILCWLNCCWRRCVASAYRHRAMNDSFVSQRVVRRPVGIPWTVLMALRKDIFKPLVVEWWPWVGSVSPPAGAVHIVHGGMDNIHFIGWHTNIYVWNFLRLESWRFLTEPPSSIHIVHGEMSILLDNIPIFMFGTTFGWKEEDSWQNLPTGQVVALYLQLHSAKLQLRGWLHVDIFNRELCYRIDEAYNSSSTLIHPLLPHGWLKDEYASKLESACYESIKMKINPAVLNQYNMTWRITHSKIPIRRGKINGMQSTENMRTVRVQLLLRPVTISDHHRTRWYRSVQCENSPSIFNITI